MGVERRADGGGAGQHGPAAGQSADHDVEPGAAFEPYRVDDAVEERAEENKERRPGVESAPGGEYCHQQQGGDAQQPMAAVAEAAAGEGPRLRAAHQAVDVALIELVEGAGGCRGYEDGDAQGEGLRDVQGRSRRDGGTRQCRKGDGEADAQLEHAEQIAQHCRRRVVSQGRCHGVDSRVSKGGAVRSGELAS